MTIESHAAAEHPLQTMANGIVVTPTLIRLTPQPVRRVIGNLSDTNQVLFGLAGT
jgi:circadian clock protein KaiB